MLRRDFLLLTLGKGPIFKDPYFWAYIKSTKQVPADCVVLSDDITENDELRLEDEEVYVSRCEPIKHLFRDRHLAYWKYLNEHGHKYRYILISDCRDVIFQRVRLYGLRTGAIATRMFRATNRFSIILSFLHLKAFVHLEAASLVLTTLSFSGMCPRSA
jgi:hypothetical protein